MTEKSLNPKIAPILNQHAGWTQNSAMREKYLHYFSNTSNESILEAYGIVPNDRQKQSDILKPKQCPNCNEGNIPNSKFCVKCRMILNYDGYVDTTQSENRIHDLEKEINSMQGSFEEFRKENRKEVEETMAKFTAELSPKALERFNKPIGKLLEED